MLLVGDVGGSNTRLALVRREDGPRALHFAQTFSNKDFPSFGDILKQFLQTNNEKVGAASIAAAGPVANGRVRLTNLPWILDSLEIGELLGADRVKLLNDLEALAAFVPIAGDSEVEILRPGIAEPCGAVAVIAPGTGLGEAFLTWDGTRYRPHASEGGHADFAPRSDVERGLQDYLAERYPHVSYERVCSGSAVPDLYDYLKAKQVADEPEWFAEVLAQADDPAAAIFDAAVDETRAVRLCQEALALFVNVLAAEAGNLALKIKATGGVYLGGGIPPRILPFLRRSTFAQTFSDKDRMKEVLEKMPISVVIEPQAALMGAAATALAN